MHFCLQSWHPQKHLVKFSSMGLLSCLVTEDISFRDEKWVLFITAEVSEKSESRYVPSLENRKVLFVFWPRASWHIALCAGALSRWRSHDLSLHSSSLLTLHFLAQFFRYHLCSQPAITSHQLIHSDPVYLLEKHLRERTFPRKTLGQMDIILNVHCPQRTLSRMYIWPNGHFPENLFSRIDTCQNVHLAEWTFLWKPNFQNRYLLEYAFGRMDIFPKTCLPE